MPIIISIDTIQNFILLTFLLNIYITENNGVLVEFSDVCKSYLGRWGEYLSVFFSLSALIGAMVVYWVLMSNFLYNTVKFFYSEYDAI